MKIENIEQEFILELNIKYNIEEYYTLDIFWKKMIFSMKMNFMF